MKIPKEYLKLFRKRDENTNKGDYGRALIIAGSYSMLGAAIIAGKACILSGVGICDIAMEKSIYEAVSVGVPEAVCTPLSDNFYEADRRLLGEKIKKADCVVIGCGMGQTDYTSEVLKLCIENCEVPLIIDADGLNILSKDLSLLEKKKCEIIITPHPAEMGRLIKKSAEEVNRDRIKTARDFAVKYGITVLLKGHNTVISSADGEYFINRSGNAGMATGGTGDMLSGIISALVSSGQTPLNAVRLGAFIHGASGDLSAKRYSMTSTCPTLMLNQLPKVFSEFEKRI